MQPAPLQRKMGATTTPTLQPSAANLDCRWTFCQHTNLPCQLRNGQGALQYLCDKLGVEDGGTTVDGLFTVSHCECLGACADAPVALVNDRQMVSYMSNDKLDELVDALKAQAK